MFNTRDTNKIKGSNLNTIRIMKTMSMLLMKMVRSSDDCRFQFLVTDNVINEKNQLDTHITVVFLPIKSNGTYATAAILELFYN